jgi:hypothetical protein
MYVSFVGLRVEVTWRTVCSSSRCSAAGKADGTKRSASKNIITMIIAAERFWELVVVLMALASAKMWKVMTDSLNAPHRGAGNIVNSDATEC